MILARLIYCALIFASLNGRGAFAGEVFPLAAGSYWIYRGPTSWTLPNPDRGAATVKSATLTWKMEVLKTVEFGDTRVALVKGMPHDLSWYKEGKQRGDYLIWSEAGTKYYVCSDKAVALFERIKNSQALPDDLKSEGELFLDFPLTKGKGFGAEAEALSHPGRYCWGVEAEVALDASAIKGAPAGRTFRVSTLAYRTSPDHTIVDFVPGLGIVGSHYGHHGTIATTDLTLVEIGHGKPL